MNTDELKVKLQGHFRDGLVTIIGAGLSVAEGVLGMSALQKHLDEEIPRDVSLREFWTPINKLLKSGENIESALIKNPPSARLESQIVKLAAQFLLDQEQKVIEVYWFSRNWTNCLSG